MAAIGTGEAFERGRDFGAWLGLVPRQYNTGGRSILGRISKCGSKYLRTLFIQAANVILMRPHNWDRFSFGAWLQDAAQRLHRNKLATALANKPARIVWSILRNEKTFDAPQYSRLNSRIHISDFLDPRTISIAKRSRSIH
ncbi:transposase [Bradyrhizobium centrosematis]|nr:transposase [Bradyrhizobium centrosematis]MCS3775844.1 transposase [Bradyrhizobium centrosematis]